jgi:hypothetical protein
VRQAAAEGVEIAGKQLVRGIFGVQHHAATGPANAAHLVQGRPRDDQAPLAHRLVDREPGWSGLADRQIAGALSAGHAGMISDETSSDIPITLIVSRKDVRRDRSHRWPHPRLPYTPVTTLATALTH